MIANTSETASAKAPRSELVLKFREPGKRPNTERWAKRPVASVSEAVEWMNANKDKAFFPASVETNAWRPEIVAALVPLAMGR